MEKLSQPPQLAQFLRDFHQKDSYNKFCVDCNKNESSHASVTYGILLCQECSEYHKINFGMENSYIKSLFDELWDEYQLKCLELGGNKRFWDFMKLYNSEWKSMDAKYKSKESKYYKKRLTAQVQGREFTEEPPARNVEEALNRGVGSAKELAGKAEDGLKTFGNYLGNKITQSGVKDKFKGLFNKNQQ